MVRLRTPGGSPAHSSRLPRLAPASRPAPPSSTRPRLPRRIAGPDVEPAAAWDVGSEFLVLSPRLSGLGPRSSVLSPPTGSRVPASAADRFHTGDMLP